MRLIDADTLKEALLNRLWDDEARIMEIVEEEIDNAPTIEALTWIPVEMREPNPEEREAIRKIYGEPDADDISMFCGPMPEDGQEILISTIYGGVYFDICSVDYEEGLNTFALENGGDWEGVTAWMPMPEPYKE